MRKPLRASSISLLVAATPALSATILSATILSATILSATILSAQERTKREPAQTQASRPAKPTSRPAKAASDRDRLRPADWGDDAPGRAVMRRKFLPIKSARYASPEKLRSKVGAKDLVIGLVVGGKAVAYPIKMLGGPNREIINEEYAGVRFCVNW